MSWSNEKLEARVVRYNEQIACKNAFIDTKTPGSDQKENFCLIGPGVSERHDQHIHIREPHGFNIGAARQPKGCLNSQHSHQTAEMFVVHEGEWKFTWGHDSSDGEAVLGPGDVISIPVNVFRGFEYVGEGKGYLFCALGGDDPGFVTWAPYVFEQAKDHGLVLLENNALIDTSIGEEIPTGVAAAKPTTEADLASFRSMTLDEMLDCVLLAKDIKADGGSDLAAHATGVSETNIIGGANPVEGLSAGKMGWNHGYQVRRLDFAPLSNVPMHARTEEEVLFVHSGELQVASESGQVTLRKGDTMTVPKGIQRSFASKPGAEIYVVRGGDKAAAAIWAN